MSPLSSGAVLLRLTAREMHMAHVLQVTRFCTAHSTNGRVPGLRHIERNPTSRQSGTSQVQRFMQKRQGCIGFTQRPSAFARQWSRRYGFPTLHRFLRQGKK